MNADEMKVQAGGRTVNDAITKHLGLVWGNYFTDEADRSVSDHRTQLAADLVECFSKEAKSLLSPVSTHARPSSIYSAPLLEGVSQFSAMLGFRLVGATPKPRVSYVIFSWCCDFLLGKWLEI